MLLELCLWGKSTDREFASLRTCSLAWRTSPIRNDGSFKVSERKNSGLRDAPSSSVCLCVCVCVCVRVFVSVGFPFVSPIGSVLLAAQKYTFQTVFIVIEANIVELFVAIHNEQVHMHLKFTHTYIHRSVYVHIYLIEIHMCSWKRNDCWQWVSWSLRIVSLTFPSLQLPLPSELSFPYLLLPLPSKLSYLFLTNSN